MDKRLQHDAGPHGYCASQFLNKLTTNKISRKQLARGECSLGS